MTLAPTLDLPVLDVRRGDPSLVRDLLGSPGVFEHGHYELLSGLHTDTFIRFSALARDAEALRTIGDWLTPSLKPWNADALVAPSTAGVALAWTLARRLAVPLHLATPGEDGRAIEIPATDALVGQRILLVNDVVTTGTGMGALARLVEDAGALTYGPCVVPESISNLARAMHHVALQKATRQTVISLVLDPYLKGKSPLVATRAPQSWHGHGTIIPLRNIEKAIPHPLPLPLPQPTCRRTAMLAVITRGGQRLTYGPCAFPHSVLRLKSAMLRVASGNH
jgi:orotate phosphoribosyltransferase